MGLFNSLGEWLYKRRRHKEFLKTPEGELYTATAGDSGDSSEGFVSVVVSGDKTYVFGPFNSEYEASEWEAGHRVALKRMLSGDMGVFSGGQAILPFNSSEAKRYVAEAGIVAPSHKEWQLIA